MSDAKDGSKKAQRRPGVERADDRINVSAAKDISFYADLAKKMLADPKTPDTLEIAGLDSDISSVMAVADILREQKLAEVSKLNTDLVGKNSDSAKMSLWVKKADGFDAVYASQLAEKADKLKERVSGQKNRAFVFIKPHAVTDKVKALVKEGLEKKGVKVLSEGSIKSEVIDKKKLIDRHYYAIASKATILKPKELNVPADKFKEQFGLEWSEALEKGVVYNAMDACKELGLTADELDAEWGRCKKEKKLVKFGGGFYCGLIEIEGKKSIYAFNGFFMSMRSKFTKPGLQIYYYNVEFDSADLKWEDFRGNVLGPTDPATAPAESLRGLVYTDWEALGLEYQPNVGDNAVHASASPFEGLAERMNWGKESVDKHPFGQVLVATGVPRTMIKDWSVDPQVVINAEGKKGSLFDQLEDMDAPACVAKCVELAALNKKEKKEEKEEEKEEKKEE